MPVHIDFYFVPRPPESRYPVVRRTLQLTKQLAGPDRRLPAMVDGTWHVALLQWLGTASPSMTASQEADGILGVFAYEVEKRARSTTNRL